MIVNLVSNISQPLLMWPLKLILRSCVGRKKVLQVDMNKYYEGPEFEIAQYYAKNLAFMINQY